MKFLRMSPVVRMNARANPYGCEPEHRRAPSFQLERDLQKMFDEVLGDRDFTMTSPWFTPMTSPAGKRAPYQQRQQRLKTKPETPEWWTEKLSLPDVFELKHVKTEVKEQIVLVTATMSHGDEVSGDKIEARRTISLPEKVQPQTVKIIKQNGKFFLSGKMKKEEKPEKEQKNSLPIGEGHKSLDLTFDLGGIDPENIGVKLHGDRLVVSGRQVQQGDGEFSSRQFYQVVGLPGHVDTDALTSRVTHQGALRVTAPARGKLSASQNKNIPVEMEKKGEKTEEKDADTTKEEEGRDVEVTEEEKDLSVE